MARFLKVKEKRPLLHLMLEQDEAFRVDKNVMYAENAFFINSLINWCAFRRRNKDISYEQFKSYMLLLEKYVKKEVDLFWKDDILHVRKFVSHKEQGENDDGNNLESFEQE